MLLRIPKRGSAESLILRVFRKTGGEGGIRTPDRLAPMPHFECGAFDHSATSPGAMTVARLRSGRVLGEDGGPDKARPGKFPIAGAQPMPGKSGTARREKTGGPVSLH